MTLSFFLVSISEVHGMGLNTPPTPLLAYDRSAPRGKLVFGVGFGALLSSVADLRASYSI